MILLYDPENKIVAFRPEPKSNPKTFSVRQTGKVYIVIGASFVQHYGIDTTVGRWYKLTEQDGLFVVDLKGTHTVVNGPGSATAAELPRL